MNKHKDIFKDFCKINPMQDNTNQYTSIKEIYSGSQGYTMRKLHREINECELWQLKQHYHNIVFTKSCYKIKFINDTVDWISSIGESYIFTKEEAINSIPPINEEQFISKCLSEVSLTLLTEGEPSKVIKYIVKLQNHEGNTHVFMDNNLFVCLLKAFILYHYSVERGLNVAQSID